MLLLLLVLPPLQAIDTICITLNDYFEDYQFLKPTNFELVITCAQDRVARKYITAMLQNNLLRRRLTFTRYLLLL